MAEYGYKELAQALGVSVRTVHRYVKASGINGTVTHSQSGSLKRVFSEVDLERLKDWQKAAVIQLPAPRGLTLSDSETVFLALMERFAGVLAERDAQHAEDLRQRDQAHAAEVAALREDLAERERAHAATEQQRREREEKILAELKAIREEVSRPWWVRLWERMRRP